MAENKSKTKLPEPGRWKRRLMRAGLLFVLLLVVIYFVATSSAFVKKVIVPRAGAALNADISLSSAQVSPFSKVILRDVKVTPKGAETLFTAAEVSARYSLRSILSGKIAVDDVTLVAPVITVVEHADGTRNLDPLLKSQQKKPEEKPTETAAGKPLEVDIKSVNVKNATLRYVKNQKDERDSFELASVNLDLEILRMLSLSQSILNSRFGTL